MGPRSVERGKGLALISDVDAAAASMGPRSVERGKDAIKALHEALEAASMGPRSVERGKAARVTHPFRFLFCFNGAAFC